MNVLLLLAFYLATTITNADVPRPRGVSLAKATLYQPTDKSWTCLDGSKTIRYTQINDDYCDCIDGSDEPGTAACEHGNFHCANVGHRPQNIPSNRVNDGICDCCDGSDEYMSEVTECTNTCKELGRAEQEQRKTEAELHKRGAAKRAEMIAKGKQILAQREVRRNELEQRRLEQEALRTEKEQLKKSAETAEAEALELYKEQQRELEAEKSPEEEPIAMQEEAEAHFVLFDVNKDGFVEITELQTDMILDRDRDGVVTVEEAKYFLDERDRVDLQDFLALSWPRIKPLRMLAEGLFKPQMDTEEQQVEDEQAVENAESLRQPFVDGTEDPEHAENENEIPENTGEEEEEEVYEDDDGDADVGVGAVTPEDTETAQAPDYDPETQHLVDMANEARAAFADVEREIRDIDNEIKDIDEQNSKDYGPNNEYAAMDGECYKFEDREYVYTLCPFDRASQKQRSGGAETTLGRWDQWNGENDDNKYTKQRYSHGASCWNGPQRSVIAQLKCALEPRITAVSEPNRCEYFFEFETPAACDEAAHAAKDTHDEL